MSLENTPINDAIEARKRAEKAFMLRRLEREMAYTIKKVENKHLISFQHITE